MQAHSEILLRLVLVIKLSSFASATFRPAVRTMPRCALRCRGCISSQIIEDPVDHHRVLDTGNDAHHAAAGRARLNVEVEHPLDALASGDRCPALDRRLTLRFIRRAGLVALTPFRGGNTGAKFSVGGEHAINACQIDSRPGHQRRQSCHAIQWLEDHMRRAIPIRRLQLVAHIAIRRQRQALSR